MLSYLKEADVLFFTTSVQNAVQSYSLTTAQLLDAAHTHPSPPTVLALSPASRLLLSASATPPTVYIQHIDSGASPTLIIPNSSSSAVVAAAFHPERYNIFALAFADATLAIFNASYLLYSKKESRSNIELASVKKLHSVGTEACLHRSECSLFCSGHDAATGNVSVGDRAISIASLAFVPGSECTTISAGADGRCCIVDFSMRAAAIKSWSLGGQATSLSAARIGSIAPNSRIDGAHSQGTPGASVHDEVLVVIGLKDGSVMLFDLDGNLKSKRMFASDVPVIDVEWLKVDHSPEGNAECPNNKPKTPSVKLALAEAYALAKSIDAKSVSLLDESLEDRIDITTTIQNNSLTVSTRQENNFDNVSNNLNEPYQASQSLPTRQTPPTIPPRPTPRKGGKLALRHAETANANATRSEQPKAIEPRRMTTSTFGRFRVPSVRSSRLGSDSSFSIPDRVPPKSEAMNGNANRSVSKSTGSADVSLGKKSSIPARLLSRHQSGLSQEQANSTPTSASNDTIIDWTPASVPRRLLPKKTSVQQLKKSRSTYVLNTNTQLDTPSQSIASDDTIIDWNLPTATFHLHENLVSPAAGTPAPASRRSSRKSRNPSSVVTPLGPSSLNPSLRIASASKLAPQTASQMPQKQRAKEASPAEVPVGEFQSGSTSLQVVFLQVMTVLQEKIANQFEGQRKWIVEYTRERDEWARKLEEENRLLREELAKERKRRTG